MELQMFGAKILAALLFILLFQASIAVAEAPLSKPVSSTNSTTPVSPNDSSTPPPSLRWRRPVAEPVMPNNNTPPPPPSLPWKRPVSESVPPTNNTTPLSSNNSTTPPPSLPWKKPVSESVPPTNNTTPVSPNNSTIPPPSLPGERPVSKPVSPTNSTTSASPNNRPPPPPQPSLQGKRPGPEPVSPNNSTTPGSPNNNTTPWPSSRWKRLARAFRRHFSNFTPEFNWEQQQYLKAHNDLRQEMGLPPLQWDAALTTYAHTWAMRRRIDCKYRKHSEGQYGENSFWMQYKDFTPTEVVQHWFSEQKLFDHTKNVCKCKIENEDCECGHYLNVIWKTTQKIGCSGYVYCANQQGLLVYCSYDPRGNYKGVNPLNP